MPERNRWKTSAAFLLLALGALVLRGIGLADKPFWIAEIQEFVYARRGGLLDQLEFSAGDFLGFFYHRLCALVGLAATPFVMRGLALAAGALLPGIVFLLLARRGHSAAGLIAGAMAALSLPLIEASQEARFYVGLTFFLSTGFLLDLFRGPGGNVAQTDKDGWAARLGLLDGLALLCHPYAAVWIASRWGARTVSWLALPEAASPATLRMRSGQAIPLQSADPEGRVVHRPSSVSLALRAIRACMASSFPPSYLVPVALACSMQAWQILSAGERYRLLHRYFHLQLHPPGFSFFAELVGHMGAGPGWFAAFFAGLALLGLFSLLRTAPAAAVRLAVQGFLAPFVLLVVMGVGGGRFSFTHMLPAAIPLYVCAGFGIVALAGAFDCGRRTRLVGAGVSAAALVGWMLPAVQLAERFADRPTRLEMGADIESACRYLGEHMTSGDVLVTSYDKYFTQLAYYCGPVLPAGVDVVVPVRPEAPWVVGFNHLFVEPGEPYLARGRVSTMSERGLSQAGGRGGRVFVLLPYFEAIEGEYSETLGWYGGRELYGPQIGPDDSALSDWQVADFPLVKVVWRDHPAETAITRVLGGIRPMM